VLSKEDVIKCLRQFVDDWRMTANLEGVPVETVQVDLISVLYDVCMLLELNPREVLGDKAEVLE